MTDARPICLVAAARPNFMKVAPICRSLRQRGIRPWLVHTGQHYDRSMSDEFFHDLRLPRPDHHLGVGSGSHGVQTARILTRFEAWLRRHAVEWVVVVGDVNSTAACALVAAKANVRVAHVEAGLRSEDPTMPEEINRRVTDAISDLLFTTCTEAGRNLRREGVSPRRIRFAGNTMIDSLLRARAAARRRGILRRLGLQRRRFALATLHRPATVDRRDRLEAMLDTLARVGERLPVVFPIHPRTRARLERWRLPMPPAVRDLPPLGYLDCLRLEEAAGLVLTDSGGMQEETTVLGVPCLTLRDNTERPITVTQGTNLVVGTDPRRILSAVDRVLAGRWKKGKVPARWDGRAAERIADDLLGPAGRWPRRRR